MIEPETGVAGFLGMSWLVRELVGYFRNKKVVDAQAEEKIASAEGKTGLIEALEQRIAASEARQKQQDLRISGLEERIAKEIDLRLAAQIENGKLKMRVAELEYAIKQIGGAVPPAN
jgi:hypothetical protein